MVFRLIEGVLSEATPYMLRNDGELLTCGKYHPYICYIYNDVTDDLESLVNERIDELRWFYNNTGNNSTKNYIQIIVKSAIYLKINKLVTSNDLYSQFMVLPDTYIADDMKELQYFVKLLNEEVNQEFCKVRTSDIKFGGQSHDVYFRISSQGFNWFPLIWEFVNKYKTFIETVTISRDTRARDFSVGEIYKINTIEVNHISTDEFLTLSGNPQIESFISSTNMINKANKLLCQGYSLTEAYPNLNPRDILGFVKKQQKEQLTWDINNILYMEREMMKFKIVESVNKYPFKMIFPENSKHEFYELNDVKNAIFLAGPCPRDPNEKDEWRDEACEILKKLNFKGTVISPTNKFYDETDKEHLVKQTNWEIESMHKASAIVFWIERSEAHPGYTTNIEFGDWYDKPGVYVGWTAKAIKNRYLQVRLDNIKRKRYASLETLLTAVVKDLERPAKRWFLSDTHLGQERTLELSKRPFFDVRDMDLTIISNWNKNIRMQDEVYFLGDFGDNFDYLNCLNYGKLHFVLGNYERFDKDKKDITDKSVEALKKFKNVKVYAERGKCKVTLSNGQEVVCIHEPLDPDKKTDFNNETCLYGHIHGRTFYKINGTDCGVDVNRYEPLSEEDVIWRLNAIQYLDENVWTNNCK